MPGSHHRKLTCSKSSNSNMKDPQCYKTLFTANPGSHNRKEACPKGSNTIKSEIKQVLSQITTLVMLVYNASVVIES